MPASPEAHAQCGKEIPRCLDVLKDMKENDHLYVFWNIFKFIVTSESCCTVYVAYAAAQVETYEVADSITSYIEKTSRPASEIQCFQVTYIRYMFQKLLDSLIVPLLFPLSPFLEIQRKVGVRLIVVHRYVIDCGKLGQAACGARPNENFRPIAAVIAIQN
jgi:hypothetical protein